MPYGLGLRDADCIFFKQEKLSAFLTFKNSKINCSNSIIVEIGLKAFDIKHDLIDYENNLSI